MNGTVNGTTNRTSDRTMDATKKARGAPGRAARLGGVSAIALGLALAAPVMAQTTTVPLEEPTVIIVPAAEADVVTTDGVPTDAGTAQALADDNAPSDADADAPSPEPEVADGGEAREGTEACVDILERIEGDFSRRAEEASAALSTMAAADPLVLRMKDGSAVDLRPADAEAGPTENWFGDPPRRTEVSSAIDAMRGFSEADSEAECLEAARTITASLNEWDGIEPVAEAMPETGAAPADGTSEGTTSADAPAETTSEEAALTPAATPATDAATTEQPTLGVEAGTEPVLTPDEEAEVSATADDTGEGDDYGAPAATEEQDVTSAETRPVETSAETDPAMGTRVEATGAARPGESLQPTEAAALGDDPTDDRTQEGPGAETPLAPLTTSDESNDAGASRDAGASSDAGAVGVTTVPVGDAAETAAAPADAPRTRTVERPGRIIIQDGDGREVDPARTGVQFRTVPIE